VRSQVRRLLLALGLLALVPASDAAAQAGVSYRIPPDNPFVGRAGAAPEVYAYGLRNPFRFSFDRESGDLLVGDVGQGAREEIDWIGVRAARGANFGWACREGTLTGPKAGTEECAAGGFVEPLFDYPRSQGQAVTGGVVVRDPTLIGLVGRYLYTDFYLGDVRSLRLDRSDPGDAATGLVRTDISSFGEDALGRVYVTDLFSNQVLRLVPGGSPGTLSEQPLSGSFPGGPVAVAGLPEDPSRLLVAEQAGTVRMVVGGAGLTTPFLDVAPFGLTSGGESGLLGVAPAPDYAASGRFYVYYTDAEGDIRIDEFQRSANPNVANPDTRRPVIEIPHPSASNHNGGTVMFGPDGCLWAATGDGGGGNDQFVQAQNLGTLLGKLVRIAPDPPDRGGAVCSFSTPPASGSEPPTQAFAPPSRATDGTLTSSLIDRTPPLLLATIARRQPLLRRRGALGHARCDEPCLISVAGRVKFAGRRIELPRKTRATAANTRLRLALRLTPAAARALRRALRRGLEPRLRLGLRARDASGNASRLIRVTIRPGVGAGAPGRETSPSG
jgi:glucose/arabinose dehydrogenase